MKILETLLPEVCRCKKLTIFRTQIKQILQEIFSLCMSQSVVLSYLSYTCKWNCQKSLIMLLNGTQYTRP